MLQLLGSIVHHDHGRNDSKKGMGRIQIAPNYVSEILLRNPVSPTALWVQGCQELFCIAGSDML